MSYGCVLCFSVALCPTNPRRQEACDSDGKSGHTAPNTCRSTQNGVRGLSIQQGSVSLSSLVCLRVFMDLSQGLHGCLSGSSWICLRVFMSLPQGLHGSVSGSPGVLSQGLLGSVSGVFKLFKLVFPNVRPH